MAKVRNAANTIRQGRIGENTWYIRDGVQVVRQRLQNSNYGEGARRSSAQQERRAKWGNLVNFYKVIKSWQPKAYESLKKGVTDYNAFMQLNANSTPVYLTRQLVEAGGAVIAGYKVSKGTLPALNVAAGSIQPKVTIGIFTTLEVSSSTTVAQLTNAILSTYPEYQDGDNLAFIFLKNSNDGDGVPRIQNDYREITLSTTDSSTVVSHGITLSKSEAAAPITFTLTDGTISTITAAVAIHTRQAAGGLQVSSQSLIVADDTILDQYTSAAAKAAAIASYGVDGDVPLAPGE